MPDFEDITDDRIQELEAIALKTRSWIVKMIHEAGSGHPGGSLSSVEMLTALYFHIMRHDPEKTDWPDRDRFVLSKGHAAPALYATLAQAGYFPEEDLMTLRKLGSKLQGHPNMNTTPGVEMSTGSLGQGLSAAVGMALGGRLDRKDFRVYCICGDGELNSGQIWEAAMSASHFKLDKLTVFVDRNYLQIDGHTEQIMSLEPLAFKFKAFGWQVFEIDGNNMREVVQAVSRARSIFGKPSIIIAQTVKGKGVSYMEGNLGFHGAPPNDEEFRCAMGELGCD